MREEAQSTRVPVSSHTERIRIKISVSIRRKSSSSLGRGRIKYRLVLCCECSFIDAFRVSKFSLVGELLFHP